MYQSTALIHSFVHKSSIHNSMQSAATYGMGSGSSDWASYYPTLNTDCIIVLRHIQCYYNNKNYKNN